MYDKSSLTLDFVTQGINKSHLFLFATKFVECWGKVLRTFSGHYLPYVKAPPYCFTLVGQYVSMSVGGQVLSNQHLYNSPTAYTGTLFKECIPVLIFTQLGQKSRGK